MGFSKINAPALSCSRWNEKQTKDRGLVFKRWGRKWGFQKSILQLSVAADGTKIKRKIEGELKTWYLNVGGENGIL
jgi:hypothetical protein